MKPRRLTPKETLHAWCHYCIQSRSDKDVEGCTGYLVYATGKPCPFYEFRMGNKRPPIKLFRQFCMECMGGGKTLVKECLTTDCLVYPFRSGRNPARIGTGASRERMMVISKKRMAVSRENGGYFQRSVVGQG